MKRRIKPRRAPREAAQWAVVATWGTRTWGPGSFGFVLTTHEDEQAAEAARADYPPFVGARPVCVLAGAKRGDRVELSA